MARRERLGIRSKLIQPPKLPILLEGNFQREGDMTWPKSPHSNRAAPGLFPRFRFAGFPVEHEHQVLLAAAYGDLFAIAGFFDRRA
jgi:hypothetical protein